MDSQPTRDVSGLNRSTHDSDDLSYVCTSSGIELTDEVIERMVLEAEAGFDLSKLRRRPGRPATGSAPADTLPVRLDPDH